MNQNCCRTESVTNLQVIFLAIELKFDVQAVLDADFHLDGLRGSFSINGLDSNLGIHNLRAIIH